MNTQKARPSAPPAARRRAPRVSVRPIRDERDYDEAIAILDGLMPLERPNREQVALRDVLLALVSAYEAEHHKLDLSGVGPIDALRCLLDEHGMSASDLGRLLGDRTVGSAILSGRRRLSKRHIAILAERFGVSADLFLTHMEKE